MEKLAWYAAYPIVAENTSWKVGEICSAKERKLIVWV
jgi:hypothetical protein